MAIAKKSLRLASLEAMRSEDDVIAIMKIDVTDMIPDPNQPRTEFDEETIADLAGSLLRQGQLEPVWVRENPEGVPSFMLVNGERRWRAAKQAGIAQLDARVYRGDPDPEAILDAQFMINFQSEQMPIKDQAAYMQRKLAKLGSVEAVAEKLKLKAKRVYKILQAANLGGIAADVRDQGLSNDPETLTTLSVLERRDPAAAKEVVEKAKAGGKKLLRRQVTERAAQVKAGGKGQAAKSKSAPQAADVLPPANPATAAHHEPPADDDDQSHDALTPPMSLMPVTVPTIFVRWAGDDDDLAALWEKLEKRGGQAYLCFTVAHELDGHAMVAFGSDKVTDTFPLDGLRIERIEQIA